MPQLVRDLRYASSPLRGVELEVLVCAKRLWRDSSIHLRVDQPVATFDIVIVSS